MEQLPFLRRVAQSTFGFAGRFVSAMREEDLGATAAQMTYYFMLALFPTLILSVWVLDLLPLPGDMAKAVGRSFHGVSREMGTLIQRYVEEFATRRPSGSLLLWIFAALWAASRGVGGARKGLDRVLRPEKRRHFAKLKAFDLVITLSAILLVGIANGLLLGGRQLGEFVASSVGLGESFAIAWAFLTWPMTVLLLLVGVVLAYRFLPSRKLPYRYLFYGAIPTVIGWLALAWGFRLWLRNLAGFDKIYGSLTSFFLLMFFLWLVSLCLLIGGQTAAVMADREGERGEIDEDDAEEEAVQAAAAAVDPGPASE